MDNSRPQELERKGKAIKGRVNVVIGPTHLYHNTNTRKPVVSMTRRVVSSNPQTPTLRINYQTHIQHLTTSMREMHGLPLRIRRHRRLICTRDRHALIHLLARRRKHVILLRLARRLVYER